MKLLIETCLDSYLVAIIKDGQVIDHIFYDKFLKKSDELDKDVKELIKDNINQLEEVYVTNGPGSFMGVRAGMIYGYTLSKALGIKLKIASSLDFVSNNNPGLVFIDAKSGMSFSKKFPDGKEELVNFQESSKLDIKKFLKFPNDYLKLFKLSENPDLNYMKEPKVG